jgi:hypothetical protein
VRGCTAKLRPIVERLKASKPETCRDYDSHRDDVYGSFICKHSSTSEVLRCGSSDGTIGCLPKAVLMILNPYKNGNYRKKI